MGVFECASQRETRVMKQLFSSLQPKDIDIAGTRGSSLTTNPYLKQGGLEGRTLKTDLWSS